MLPILKEALTHVKSVPALAKAMGRSRQGLYILEELTGEDAVAIETATNGAIPRSRIRPDLWPPAAAPKPTRRR